MARGFESKSVASQQESAFGALDRDPERADPQLQERRRGLELALADVMRRQGAARAEAHRLTLQRARDALEAELKALTSDRPERKSQTAERPRRRRSRRS